MAEIIHRITDRHRIEAFRTGQVEIDPRSEQAEDLILAITPGQFSATVDDVDYSPQLARGTRFGNPATTTIRHPRYGALRALNFDGVDDYVSITPKEQFDALTEFTLLAWFNVPSYASNPMWFSAQGSNNGGMGFQIYDQSGQLKFWVYTDNVGTLISNETLSTNTWYSTVGAWDGSTVYGWINGVLHGSSARSAANSGTWNEYYVFHSSFPPTLLHRYHPGIVADVRVYNKYRDDLPKEYHLRPWLLYKPRRSITYSIPAAPPSSTPYYYQRRRRVLS